jgi:hypothetical protein
MLMMCRASPRCVQTNTTNRASSLPRRDEARLAVCETRIFARRYPARKNLRRIGEIKSPLGERLVPLSWVEGDFQEIICNAK